MCAHRRVEINNESDIVTARQTGRTMAAESEFGAVDCAQIATAISELARNIFRYAVTGAISINIINQNSKRKGIEIISTDQGKGIENIELVMQDGYSTSNGLGLGLPGVKRIMDEFEISSKYGKGTNICVKKWLRL